ncbi:DUF1801 domain-containing protein [Prosthecobacter vanneervenii]|uniref:Uncharacterized protein YdeI (YjbR/CyaY-like superfamily) n=1 Tax=Prosthecobacter vanneervenii TaxID=48466 RepID=A0A7W7Y8W5_9BACT|nr:DUF1801 domain-containing protein [Prosthecobacter vanneervenii]MBB5031762.1 uncharacterized protein YdeI (YjbR/CyaY-like superfamily) [Prosthecobacter vanneervenii]
MHPEVDAYISNESRWKPELTVLRRIVLSMGLTEEWKWRKPCYTHAGTNLILIHGFKESCALMFCQGSLLKDPRGLLQKPGENSQDGRLIKFTSVREIEALETEIRTFIEEAKAAEDAGLKPAPRTTTEPVPEELKQKLEESGELKKAFAALTPGRRRAYLLHFNGAKQAATRCSRIEACRARILAGKGPHDCICGHSQRMPNCDGSHKRF